MDRIAIAPLPGVDTLKIVCGRDRSFSLVDSNGVEMFILKTSSDNNRVSLSVTPRRCFEVSDVPDDYPLTNGVVDITLAPSSNPEVLL